jgi:PhnB protein
MLSSIPNYVPSGHKTINITLTVKNAEKALEFYNRAFGADTIMVLKGPDGVVGHAEFKIDDTIIMLTEEGPNGDSPLKLHGTPVTIQIYTPDCEGFFEEAVKAGAKVLLPIRKQFYGDRAGLLEDPFGHRWIIATHMEDLTARELQNRFNELF